MAFSRPNREVDRVYVHCSASDNPDHDDVDVIRGWHIERGFNDVGYHFFVKKDGELQDGRDLEKTPAAQKGRNRGTIAICLHGLAVERFTKPQYRTLIDLCNEISDAYAEMITFHGHCEVSSKSCPVMPYREVLGLDKHGNMELEQTVSPTIVATRHDHGKPTLRLMSRGPEVAELQALLSEAGQDVEEDGIFGQMTEAAVKAFQAAQNLRPDGIVGPRTWKALLR